MRTLIVGCGYVGLPLAAELVRRGHEVFGLRRSDATDAELKASGITPLHADITQAESLAKLPRNFDWVVNCAASGGGAADDYRKVYLDGNRNLIAWLRNSLLKKFIYTSSTGVYGQNDGSIVTEKSPTEPEAETARILAEAERLLLNSDDDASCLRGDEAAMAAQARGRSLHRSSIPAIILRVAGIYGPGRGWWLKQFLAGQAQIEGDGSRWLNMIHRDDLIRVIIAALERGVPGETYNATDNEPVTQLKLYEWLAAKLNRLLPAVVAANAEVLRKRGATSKRVSNEKLRKELRPEFQFPDFRAGYTALLQLLASSPPSPPNTP